MFLDAVGSRLGLYTCIACTTVEINIAHHTLLLLLKAAWHRQHVTTLKSQQHGTLHMQPDARQAASTLNTNAAYACSIRCTLKSKHCRTTRTPGLHHYREADQFFSAQMCIKRRERTSDQGCLLPRICCEMMMPAIVPPVMPVCTALSVSCCGWHCSMGCYTWPSLSRCLHPSSASTPTTHAARTQHAALRE